MTDGFPDPGKIPMQRQGVLAAIVQSSWRLTRDALKDSVSMPRSNCRAANGPRQLPMSLRISYLLPAHYALPSFLPSSLPHH